VTIKFNFYDIYGFALPGFLLVALLWLPFGLIENRWPDAEFSSALVGVILAYIAGHVLQQVAGQAIPSSFLGGRYPSSVFLDKDDLTFSEEFKTRLRHQILTTFGLDVSDGKVRRDAFFLCRSALIKSKTAVYPEQFEGLYALMRGLCAAFGIAVVYYLGWAYSGGLHRFVRSAFGSWQWSGLAVLAGIVIASFALITADRLKDSKDDSKRVVKYVMIGSLLIAVFAAGYYLGLSSVKVSEHRGQFIAAAVLSFFASERCYAGYKAFAQEFAKAVYRDFSNYEKPVEALRANPEPDPAGE
jgi:hypothetical protein